MCSMMKWLLSLMLSLVLVPALHADCLSSPPPRQLQVDTPGSPERIRLSDFKISLSPPIENMSTITAGKARDVAETLFEDFLEGIVDWRGAFYAYAGLSGIETVTLDESVSPPVSVMSIWGGLVVFDGASTNVPSESDMMVLLEMSLVNLAFHLQHMDEFAHIESATVSYASQPTLRPSPAPSPALSPDEPPSPTFELAPNLMPAPKIAVPTPAPSPRVTASNTVPSSAPTSMTTSPTVRSGSPAVYEYPSLELYGRSNSPSLAPSDLPAMQLGTPQDLESGGVPKDGTALIAGSVAFIVIIMAAAGTMGRWRAKHRCGNAMTGWHGLDSLQLPDTKSESGSSLLGRLMCTVASTPERASNCGAGPSPPSGCEDMSLEMSLEDFVEFGEPRMLTAPSPTPTTSSKLSWLTDSDDNSYMGDFDDEEEGKSIQPKIVQVSNSQESLDNRMAKYRGKLEPIDVTLPYSWHKSPYHSTISSLTPNEATSPQDKQWSEIGFSDLETNYSQDYSSDDIWDFNDNVNDDAESGVEGLLGPFHMPSPDSSADDHRLLSDNLPRSSTESPTPPSS